MYTKEWLPQVMLIGVRPDEFWRMNPRLLSPYYKAERLRQEKWDTQMWLMGSYVFEAVSISLGNAFRKKGKKPIDYPNKPHMANVREERGELTEEEKKKKTELLFNALSIMKVNHDLEKKYQGEQAS